eukprot:12357-Heterococcus_DN1.PRE.2
MQPTAVRIYLLGLLITAVMAVAVRFDILLLVVTGKLPQCECEPADDAAGTTNGGGINSDSAGSSMFPSSTGIGQPS